MKNYIPIICLSIFGIITIGMQLSLGWIAWGIGILSLIFTSRDFKLHIGLLFISIGILGMTQIDTSIEYRTILSMATALCFAILIPWYISRQILNTNVIELQFNWKESWPRKRWYYMLFALIASSIIMPWYMKSTGAYLNWSVVFDASHITRLFIGTNALGIWDELFFINIVFAIYRRFFNFWTANFFQAILFTTFLFELGFTGWGPLLIYPFALVQGYIYEKTQSLSYVITIHLIIDFVLFVTLVVLHG